LFRRDLLAFAHCMLHLSLVGPPVSHLIQSMNRENDTFHRLIAYRSNNGADKGRLFFQTSEEAEFGHAGVGYLGDEGDDRDKASVGGIDP